MKRGHVTSAVEVVEHRTDGVADRMARADGRACFRKRAALVKRHSGADGFIYLWGTA